MAQINIHVSPEFDKALRRFMRLRGLKNKSEAIRLAVFEGLERTISRQQSPDFSEWIGLGEREPVNPSPRFASEDDLWSA